MSQRKTEVHVRHLCVIGLLVALMIGLGPLRAESQAEPPTPQAGTCRQKEDVRVYRALMDPKNVADVFGRRIAKRYVAIQVTITNRCKDYQYLIHDVSLDVSSVFSADTLEELKKARQTKMELQKSPEVRKEIKDLEAQLAAKKKAQGEASKQEIKEIEQLQKKLDKLRGTPDLKYEQSSEELSIVQGVAEKGQSADRRNLIYRLLRAAGTIAGGISGVTVFGSSYAPSVAAFNGPLLTAYSEAFPDFTINQLIRLNHSAYVDNKVIPKQQALVMVAFIPQAIFMNKEQRKKFWNDPTSIQDDIDFRNIDVLADGNFITEVSEAPPSISRAQIEPEEMKKFQNGDTVVSGYVIGQSLSGASVSLKDAKPGELEASVAGTPTDNKLEFKITSKRPIAPGRVLTLEIKKKDASAQSSLQVAYAAAKPSLTSATTTTGQPSGDSDAEIPVQLSGTNFLPGATQAIVAGCGTKNPFLVLDDDKTTATSLAGKFTLLKSAKLGDCKFRVMTPGGPSEEKAFSSTTPQP